MGHGGSVPLMGVWPGSSCAEDDTKKSWGFAWWGNTMQLVVPISHYFSLALQLWYVGPTPENKIFCR